MSVIYFLHKEKKSLQHPHPLIIFEMGSHYNNKIKYLWVLKGHSTSEQQCQTHMVIHEFLQCFTANYKEKIKTQNM